MTTKRHRWGPGLRQVCLLDGCPWWRTPKDSRHGGATMTMLYAKSETRKPAFSEFAPMSATPPCESSP